MTFQRPGQEPLAGNSPEIAGNISVNVQCSPQKRFAQVFSWSMEVYGSLTHQNDKWKTKSLVEGTGIMQHNAAQQNHWGVVFLLRSLPAVVSATCIAIPLVKWTGTMAGKSPSLHILEFPSRTLSTSQWHTEKGWKSYIGPRPPHHLHTSAPAESKITQYMCRTGHRWCDGSFSGIQMIPCLAGWFCEVSQYVEYRPAIKRRHNGIS